LTAGTGYIWILDTGYWILDNSGYWIILILDNSDTG